jgi:phosphomannomutase
MATIAFGTDGWRAIIGKEYTFDNLAIVTQATARWIIDENITTNGVVIGYDCRFMSRDFAEHAACHFAAMGIPVRMATSIVSTPAVSWAALHYDAVGIVITASHNPPQYNGFKIKAPFGGPASPDQIQSVETFYEQFDSELHIDAYKTCLKQGRIREIPLADLYLELLRSRLDLEAIKATGIKIAHDAMYGASRGVIKSLLGDQVYELHGDLNPGFMGTPPEPIESNLKELAAFIRTNRYAVGIANDGDGDRIGMYDEEGTYVDSHQLLSLLVWYLHTQKGLSGTIIKTFSTTQMLDKMAAEYNLPIIITPIGFKYIAEKIVDSDVLVGGEESGGLAVKGHIPERDGIYIGILIIEMMVKTGKSLSELVRMLFDQFGEHHNRRADLHTTNEFKDLLLNRAKMGDITQILGNKVENIETLDGVKLHLSNGSRLLIRASGTEPVLRIYCESNTPEDAQAIVDEIATRELGKTFGLS